MNAKEFAEEARRMAKPNMIQIARMWFEGPATEEEWEHESITMHEEQHRRSEEYHAKEATRAAQCTMLVRS